MLNGFSPSIDNPGYHYPGARAPRGSNLVAAIKKQAKHTQYFAQRISFAEHWKLVAESSEFHLMLSRAHRAHFSNSKYEQKRDILKSGMAREFTPGSGNVDT